MGKKHNFTFIDLFAGIGGFHIAMHNIGGECVFASEMDIAARTTYEHNFKKISPKLFKENKFNDDIRNINPNDIPDFDVLCAGFPCQPFSQAGHKRGFEDNHNSERGNLFFNIAEILEIKKPKAFFLENVRGIVSHDNGKTFKIIREILENELGYSFYFKIVKASDYGLPQLRPRTFMIGFREETSTKGFTFPKTKPLKLTMSEVWEGDCSREIGFTIRVGGRGSKINDRRNWDSYLVNGEVKLLGVKQGKRMQGFPEEYEFPVSKTQAIKQLGNSVAIDAIQEVGNEMLTYLKSLENSNLSNPTIKETKNKGEWTELLVFTKLLAEQKLYFSDKNLNQNIDLIDTSKLITRNLDLDFLIVDKTTIKAVDNTSGKNKIIDISSILNERSLKNITQSIGKGKATFKFSKFEITQYGLGFNVIKGAVSNQNPNEGLDIKSYLSSNSTLLNASGNTNFIFEVKGIDQSKIDKINQIDTRTKLKDRINYIEELGGTLNYIAAEKELIEHNLKTSDGLISNIIGYLLLNFYKKGISKLSKIVEEIHTVGFLNKEVNYGEKEILEIKLKRLLIDILLGFFTGKKWDGEYLANGTIVMKKSGDCIGFTIIDSKNLKDYLFENISLDTPASTRHRFGKIYKEKDGKLYFKLNLQLRF